MLRDCRDDLSPTSFSQRLKQSGLTLNKVVHFTRSTILGGNVARLSLPIRLEDRRRLFVSDTARFLHHMQQDPHSKLPSLPRAALPQETYELPSGSDGLRRAVEKGVLKLDAHSFVLDTTLNNSVLQLIQEAGRKPAVIMRQLTFWQDGADQDPTSLDSWLYVLPPLPIPVQWETCPD